MIQVKLPNLAIEELGLDISALTVEKSGGEWFVRLTGNVKIWPSSKPFLKSFVFPARDILINGKSLDHFLAGTETKDI